MVSQCAAFYVYAQSVAQSMIPIFDLNQAVGAQLDIIGQWVGVSRNISVPIIGVYFSWDTTQAQGWDYGSWQPSTQPAVINVLPDDVYLTLIKAKIAANSWDGTTNAAYAIWDQLFPNFTILIQDNENMSYDLAIVGMALDSLTEAIIIGGYIPLKPEGVLVNAYYIPVDTNPLFAWDVESTYLGGWDEASWAKVIPNPNIPS
jgi:hypothetical protein